MSFRAYVCQTISAELQSYLSVGRLPRTFTLPSERSLPIDTDICQTCRGQNASGLIVEFNWEELINENLLHIL